MINKRELFRKLKKNKFLVLAISVIVITGIYYGAQKAIDSYNFKSNSDFVEFEDAEGKEELEREKEESKGWFEKLFSGDEDGTEEGAEVEESVGVADNSGKVPENEVDLELDETVESSTDVEENAGQEEDENSGIEEKIYVYITGEVNVPRSCNFK